MEPKLIIHGGAGPLEGQLFDLNMYAKVLSKIIKRIYPILKTTDARNTVINAVHLLEDNPIFNAGTGSRLQEDGQVRMSAAIMDSHNNRFSGVINIKNVKNPIDVANRLAKEKYTVLGGNEATEYARLHSIPFYNPITEARLREYKSALAGDSGTVGVIALDSKGNICVGTSTGGIGYEISGRISDSATVAGTYATKAAGVSCTGRGEHIVNQAAASRIVTRVEDGMSLQDAVDNLMKEANKHKYRFGLIALDKFGNMAVGNTKNIEVLYAHHDGKKVKTFLK